MPFDPDQPRDEHGRWTDGGAETSTLPDAGSALKRAASDLKNSDVNLPFTPNKFLDEKQRVVENRFIAYLQENFYQLEQKYLSDPKLSGDRGNIVSADNAKELSPDYSRNNESRSELAPAVHEPASAFVKKLYDDLLSKPPVSNSVVFTAGGTGAGKTTSIDSIQEIHTLSDKADVVYDSNLSAFGSAKSKIEKALSSGRDVSIIFVHRDIEDAFKNGVIPRMQRVGRSVPITEHVERTIDALKTADRLNTEFSSNKKVQFRFIDNSHGTGKAVETTIENLKKKTYLYNSEKIQKDLTNYVQQLHKSGQITDREYRGLTTKTGG